MIIQSEKVTTGQYVKGKSIRKAKVYTVPTLFRTYKTLIYSYIYIIMS